MLKTAANVRGKESISQNTILEIAPKKAQLKIIRQVFTGLFLALLLGFENSVKATNKGGATQKFRLNFIVGIEIIAAKNVLKMVFAISDF